MKNHIHIILLIFCTICIYSCEPAPKNSTGTKSDVKPSEQIDKAAEEASELIDVFSKKAKEFLEGDEMDDLKEMVDDFSNKANDMVKDTAIWKAKLEELKNDEELKKLLENYKNDGSEVLTKLEQILEDLGEKAGDNK